MIETTNKEEADRYVATREAIDARGLQEFLDWLMERYVFAKWSGRELECADVDEERLFAEYFGLDLKKVEAYRRELLGQSAVEHGGHAP